MKNKWLWLLSAGLTTCGGKMDIELPPCVALTHQHDMAFQQQSQLLQARQVRVSASLANTYDDNPPVILTLQVAGIWNKPVPDTLRQRLRKLAHLLVANLAKPENYSEINVQVSESTGFFEPYIHPQSFTYSLASLR